MDGDEMAINNQRPGVDHSGRIRPDPQPSDRTDEHRTGHCVSCAARTASIIKTTIYQKVWEWGIATISVTAFLGSIFYLVMK